MKDALKIGLLLAGVLSSGIASAQKKSSHRLITYLADIGIDRSISAEKSAYKTGIQNPNLSISYYSKKNYEHPALRFRFSVFYSKNNKLFVGLQSGITWHLNEIYYGNEFSYATLPLQAILNQQILDIRKTQVLLEFAAGVNIFRLYDEARNEKTGLLTSLGIRTNIGRNFSIRTGVELQVDNVVRFVPDDYWLGLKEESIRFKQRREQVYLCAGFHI